MDRLTTKTNLRKLLESRSYGVIALTGVWGSGKTHLWNELAAEQHIDHCYYSLFGTKDAAQIKKGLALSRVHLDEEQGAQIQSVWKRILPSMSTTLDSFAESKGLVGAAATAVSGLIGDSVIERLVEKSVVVLDDIERADPKLSIESIMGVIDDLRRAGCTVLVILSSGNLSAALKDKWKEFYEKTIDIELSLQTDGEDAFEAVRGHAPTRWLTAIRKAWLASGCRNIRLAQRVVRTVDTIFNDAELHEKLAETLIADTVWLTVAQYEGLVKGADAADVLSAVRRGAFQHAEEMSETTRRIRTALPVTFSYYEDFQDSVVSFLASGNLDIARWETQFAMMDRTYRAGNLIGRLTSWIQDAHWNPERTEADLRRDAEDLLEHVYLLKLHDAQGFMSGLKEIGLDDLLEPFVENWCRGVETHRIAYPTDFVYGPLDGIDVRMMEANQRVHAQLSQPPTLQESLEKIMTAGGWSNSHDDAINDATEKDWREFLLSAAGTKHILLVRKLLESNYDKVSAGASTAAAVCRQIAFSEPDTRLGRLLRQRGIVQQDDAVPG